MNGNHLETFDKSKRKIFDDDMFVISHLYNSACSYSVKYVRIHPPVFTSIIFHHYKQLMQLTYKAAD